MSGVQKTSAGTLLIAGIAGGFISAMVKSGTEDIMPPRLPGVTPPPIQMLDAMGFHADKMNYVYCAQTINWGGNGVHILFSIVIAVIYCFLVPFNKIFKIWAGIPFGLIIAFGAHSFVLPLLGIGQNVFLGPVEGWISEIIGTILWMWTIECFRRYFVAQAQNNSAFI